MRALPSGTGEQGLCIRRRAGAAWQGSSTGAPTACRRPVASLRPCLPAVEGVVRGLVEAVAIDAGEPAPPKGAAAPPPAAAAAAATAASSGPLCNGHVPTGDDGASSLQEGAALLRAGSSVKLESAVKEEPAAEEQQPPAAANGSARGGATSSSAGAPLPALANGGGAAAAPQRHEQGGLLRKRSFDAMSSGPAPSSSSGQAPSAGAATKTRRLGELLGVPNGAEGAPRELHPLPCRAGFAAWQPCCRPAAAAATAACCCQRPASHLRAPLLPAEPAEPPEPAATAAAAPADAAEAAGAPCLVAGVPCEQLENAWLRVYWPEEDGW